MGSAELKEVVAVFYEKRMPKFVTRNRRESAGQDSPKGRLAHELFHFRNAGEKDRRYLLYNPTSKMKVTLQSEEVVNLLWEVIAAKGFESDTYFHVATSDVRGPSKLEGTVHVNVQLIRKFMNSYFFNPAEYPYVRPEFTRRDDAFVFRQGPAKGLGSVRFHDYRPILQENGGLPNVATFTEQVEIFKQMLEKAGPGESRTRTPRSRCRSVRCSRSSCTRSSSSSR